MKVLHVSNFYSPHRGGIETHLKSLCGELRKRMEVQVIVANDRWSTVSEVVDGVTVSRMGRLLELRRASICPLMLSQIRSSKADLVHLHCPNPTAILAYLGSGHSGRLIVTYHSDFVRQKLLGALFEPILHAFLRRSAAIIVTSPNYLQASRILARYHSRCRVIPLGISLAPFENPDLAAAMRLHEQYGNDFVFSLGRLIYYKGFEFLIRAMAKVNGKLLIAGDGPLRGSLQQLSTSLHLDRKVTFLGEIHDGQLASYYHASSLFVLPSIARTEAFGIVQLEAMACSKPVVNTSLQSGVPYVSLDQITGLTVPPADPDALADAINRLLTSEALRNQYGRAALRRVRGKFSLELMVDRIVHLYEEVMNAPQPRGS